MKRLAFLFLIVTLTLQVQAAAPEPKSAWEFNAPDRTRATIGAPLQLVGTIQEVPGVNAGEGAIQIGEGSYFICTHGIAPNGGGSKVNEWTLLIDFSYPPSSRSDPPNGYNDLFQTNPTDADDADWTINSSGAIGIGAVGYSSTRNYTTNGNTWYRMVVVVDNGVRHDLYMDGVEAFKGTQQGVDGRFSLASTILLFCAGNNQDRDDAPINVSTVAFWDTPLSAGDILALGRAGDKFFTQKRAAGPAPADGVTDVPRDATLNWTAGEYSGTHDVYFGTTAADVNDATRADAKGVLVSQGQAEATFAPAGSFAYGQTYYWRIDEVNQSADGTIFKGNVWSFTAEPYGYPIKPVSATASTSQPGMGPEKTIDGSGLDKADQHGTEQTTMWMSTGVGPNWIQYQFDKTYRFHELKVWNSNYVIEPYVGFGAKTVTIEYSTDGTTWTLLANVPEFARATGLPTYAANTTVGLGGIEAKYIKLTITASWGVGGVCGLSEVRFSYVPVQARSPQPAHAATGVAVDTSLNWRPGREAGSHKLFLGTDQAAVAGGTATAATVTDHSYTPSDLTFGTAYYWKVDEVNTVSYPGDVWSFTTQDYAAVDNFETYTNDEGGRIYESWIDGWTNGTGSVVGYLQAPFAEQTIVHAGRQSMPLEYNNIKAPYYSEAERTFDTTQDWTGNSADTLALFYQGRAAAFLDKGNNAFTVSGSGTDIWNTADQFRFVYKSLSGDGSMTVKVDSVANTNAWAKAGPMIRETLDAGAKNAYIAVTPGNGVSFQWRPTINGTSSNAPTAALKAPYWVRITRTGNVLKAERSADGKTWTQQGTDQTITMTSSVYIGLAVTSHNAAQTTVAEFSNVATAGTVTGSWQALAIGAAMPTNDPASLYLTVADKAGKSKTVVNADPWATTVTAWTEWRIPLSDLSAAGVNLSAIKKITIGIGDRTSPKAGAAGMLYLDDIGFGHPAK
jgi:regulation of enolase protein 1 (concanavalin A-like superfamily)